MSRITINVATHAAEKMADVVFNEKINDAENRAALYVDCLWDSKVPSDIKLVSKNFPEWLSMDRAIDFKFENKRITGYAITEHMVTKAILISDIEFKALKRLKDEILELRKQRQAYIHGLRNYLVGLVTMKRVKEEFPEALEYLGESPVAAEKGAYEELRMKIRNAKNEK